MTLAAETEQVHALVADRYLESLFLAAERRAYDAPADPSLPADLRATARRLAAGARRIAPSVRFEERLAATLEAEAGRLAATESGRLAAAAPADDLPPLRLLPPAADTSPPAADTSPPAAPPFPMHDASNRIAPEIRRPRSLQRRPTRLVIGGAITSVAISLAGGALLARRRQQHAPAETV